MCLDRIIGKYAIPETKPKKGYQVFLKDTYGVLYTAIMEKPVGLNIMEEAEKIRLRSNKRGKTYMSGFHIFESKEDACQLAGFFNGLLCYSRDTYTVRPVVFHGKVTKGKKRIASIIHDITLKAIVHVAEYRKVLNEEV